MKFLLVSERFFPSVGGVETVTRLLAEWLFRAGHHVSVATREGEPASERFGYKIFRKPGPISLLRHYAGADAVIFQGEPLRLGWPLFWGRYPAVIVHHMQPRRPSFGPAGCLQKHLHLRFAARVRHVAISHSLAQTLPFAVEAVLPNPYDAEIFHAPAATQHRRDLIFVGRLIAEKGAHVLIEAMAILKESQVCVTATIVGDGPEGMRLRDLVQACGLGDKVEFAGQVTGNRLARLLREHRVLAVPSVYEEAFGIVALEGIACGCSVIGSDVGGLPEAIGSCGRTFPAKNARALALNIQELLLLGDPLEKIRGRVQSHLERHHPKAVAQHYIDLFSAARIKPIASASDNLAVRQTRSMPCVL